VLEFRHDKVAEVLLRAGADIKARDKYGDLYLENPIVKKLMRNEAKI